MIGQFSKVKVVAVPGKFLNDSMLDWIAEHRDRTFTVERIIGDTAKLYKVDFWVTLDLLVLAD